MSEVDLNISPAAELEEIRGFGADDEAGGFRVRFADQPIAHSLVDVFRACGVTVPPELQLYQMFNIWVVPHDIGIIRVKGNADIISLGMEFSFHNTEETCSVISLFPSSEFVELGGGSFNGSVSAIVTPTGDIGQALEFLGGLFGAKDSTSATSPKEFMGLHFQARLGGTVALNIAAKVVTPKIAAIGRGSARPQWHFDLHNEPLHGRDIRAWSFLVVPKHRKTLSFDARYYVVHRTLFFPSRKESAWQTIHCTLAKE